MEILKGSVRVTARMTTLGLLLVAAWKSYPLALLGRDSAALPELLH